MGERRKRKSLWSEEVETKPFTGNHSWIGKDKHHSHDSEHDHEFPASGSHGVPKFRYHSGHPSMESIHEEPVAWINGSFTKGRESAYEGKEIGGENSYYQDMSPEFKYNHFLEDDRSQSCRYPGRGRSRSRSRSRSWSRNRGRCRSRSLSRGREKERTRGGSRSRSRSDSDARGWTRSRSPLRDYKHQASGWSDRRSLPEKYFHPKNTSYRDGGLGGADTSESRRSRADHGNDSKQSYSRGPRIELRGDVSDPYHGEDEQFQGNSRNAVLCRDFVKGKCRWGNACKFSHHVASDETSVEGTKRSSSDKDPEHQPYRNRNPLCKFFAAGKCDRDNCRFPHEDKSLNRLEGRLGKVNNDRGSREDDRSSRDKVSKRDGLRWDVAGRISDDMKPSSRNSSVVTVTDSTADNSIAGHNNRMTHSLRSENVNLGLTQHTDNLVPINCAGHDSYDGDLGTTESVIKENMVAKQDFLMFHGSQLQNQDGNTNKLQVDQRFPLNAWQQNVSPVSHIQHQKLGVVENIVVSSFHSDIVDEVKDTRNATVPAFLSGQISHQNGENVLTGYSSISEKADSKEMSALNGAEMHPVANLNFSQIQKLQTAIQMAGMSETNASLPFPNSVTSEQSAQFANTFLSAALQQVASVPNQRFENHHSTKIPVEEISNSTGMVLSTSNASGHVPLDLPASIQLNPVTVSHVPLSPVENGRSSNEHGEGNKVPLPNKSEIDNSGRSKLQQETANENPECDEVKGGTGEQSKGIQDGKQSEALDGPGKADESNANKDDKGMRLFKNSLIEFVKDKLKPKWKEGKMSRDVHKTIVKKVVDKITSSIQTDHVPKTQEKVEQYLSFSEPKIGKLVQAYVDRCLKTDS